MSFFIPQATPGGGTRVGNSYIALFANCPRKWFNSMYRPVETVDREGKPATAQGIRPKSTAPPLLSGSILHEGLEAWYRSGCRDGEDTGEYSVERAVETARIHWTDRLREYPPDENAEDDWLMNQEMLLQYAEAYGPDSGSPDWPDIRVAHDAEGEPLVEREFVHKLGYEDYIFTCRADLVVYHRGFLKVMEHKSSVAGFVRQRITASHYDSQMTGECWVLGKEFPDVDLNGVLVNVILKKRSARSKYDVAERETVTRTPAELFAFPWGAVEILKRIDDSIKRFEDCRILGMTVDEAASMAFPDHGTRTGTCTAYNRTCEYAGLCKQPGREDQILNNFRPRAFAETEKDREATE